MTVAYADVVRMVAAARAAAPASTYTGTGAGPMSIRLRTGPVTRPQPLFRPAPTRPIVGPTCAARRNALCPCGSGRKFKRCHLKDTPAPAAA